MAGCLDATRDSQLKFMRRQNSGIPLPDGTKFGDRKKGSHEGGQ